MANGKERLTFVDTARAIAIFLVIVGHLVPGESPIFRFIFAFHMPVFFFLSGYCTKRTEEPFLRFVGKKAKALLIPYAVFALISVILLLIFPVFREAEGIKAYVVRYLYITQPYAWFGALWFLVCLFICSVMFYCILKIWDGKNAWWLLPAAAVFMVAAPMLYMMVASLHYGRLPWKIDSAIGALPFMILGYVFREKARFEKWKWPVHAGIIVTAPVLIWLFGMRLNGYVNLCDTAYGNPVFYYLAALTGCLFMLSLGKLTVKVKLFAWLGRNSLFIFAIHGIVIFAAIRIYGLIAGIEAEYLPDGILVFAVALAVYALCALLALGFEQCKKLVKRWTHCHG